IEGELDDISGAGQTRAAHGLCTGVAPALHQHIEVEGAGHYGIFSGRRWREKVYPQVRDFILAHTVQPPLPVDDGIGHDSVAQAQPAAPDRGAIIALPTETAVELAQVTPPGTAKTVLEEALAMGLAPEPAKPGSAAPSAEAPKRKPRGPRRT